LTSIINVRYLNDKVDCCVLVLSVREKYFLSFFADKKHLHTYEHRFNIAFNVRNRVDQMKKTSIS